MAAHAILAPSAASRWLACTPSARLEQDFPDKAGEVAAEGTLAHRLGEAMIRMAAKQISKAQYKKELAAVQADRLYQPEMHDYCEEYAAFVMERYADALSRNSDAQLFVETRLDLTEYVPEGFGTGDVCIVADHVADFIDLKYGKGVEVSAVNNKQMMLYALGLLREFDFLYDIRIVRMTIYQPRIGNISEWEMDVEELRQWAETELRPRARLAFDGQGDFTPGKHCQFCRARVVCKAHADHQLQLARHDFKAPTLLADEDVSDVLSRAASFKTWIREVEDFALDQAVNSGKRWPGFKLVEGRSNRSISDPASAAQRLAGAGYKEELIWQPREIYGITALEKNIGKKVLPELLGGLISKPPGKPTLAPVDDKRPELTGVEKAAEDFAEAID